MNAVVEDLITAVEARVSQDLQLKQTAKADPPTNNSSKDRRRGLDKRHRYTASFKAEVIGDYEADAKAEELALRFRINRTLLSAFQNKCSCTKIIYYNFWCDFSLYV